MLLNNFVIENSFPGSCGNEI